MSGRNEIAELGLSIRSDEVVKANRHLDAMADKGKKVEATTQKMERSFASLAKQVVAIYALERAIGSAVSTYMQFSRAMANVGSVASANAAQMKQLENAARSMAKTSVFSANEAAQAQYYLASAGMSVNEIINAQKGVMSLAAATQADLASTSASVSSALSQFNLKANEAARVANVYSAAISGSQANMEKLTYSMSYVGPVAASVGQNLEGTVAQLMALYDAGLGGSQAGTALRAMLLRLQKPTKEMDQILSQLGVTIKDTTTGKVRPLVEIMADLRAANMDAGQATALFGQEATSAALKLAENTEKVRENALAITGTNKAAEMAQQQLDNLWGDVKQLGSAAEESAIKFGGSLSPALRESVQAMTYLINHGDDVATTLKAIAAASAVAFAATGRFNGAMSSLWALMSGNPIALAATAIGGLTLAISLLHESVDEFNERYETMLDNAVKSATEYRRAASAYQRAESALEKYKDDIKTAAGNQEKELAAVKALAAKYPALVGQYKSVEEALRNVEKAQGGWLASLDAERIRTQIQAFKDAKVVIRDFETRLRNLQEPLETLQTGRWFRWQTEGNFAEVRKNISGLMLDFQHLSKLRSQFDADDPMVKQIDAARQKLLNLAAAYVDVSEKWNRTSSSPLGETLLNSMRKFVTDARAILEDVRGLGNEFQGVPVVKREGPKPSWTSVSNKTTDAEYKSYRALEDLGADEYQKAINAAYEKYQNLVALISESKASLGESKANLGGYTDTTDAILKAHQQLNIELARIESERKLSSLETEKEIATLSGQTTQALTLEYKIRLAEYRQSLASGKISQSEYNKLIVALERDTATKTERLWLKNNKALIEQAEKRRKAWDLLHGNIREGAAAAVENERKLDEQALEDKRTYYSMVAELSGDTNLQKLAAYQSFVDQINKLDISDLEKKQLLSLKWKDLNKSALDQMIEDWGDTNKIIQELNKQTWESIQNSIKSAISGIIHGEDGWNSLEDSFRSLGDTLVEIAEDIASQIMTALALKGLSWLLTDSTSGNAIDNIVNKILGNSNGSSSGVGSVLGGASSMASIVSAVETVSGWMSLAAAEAAASSGVMGGGVGGAMSYGMADLGIGAAAEAAAGAEAASGALAVGAIAPMAAILGPIAVAAIGGMIFNSMAEQMTMEEAQDALGNNLAFLETAQNSINGWNFDNIQQAAWNLELFAERAGLTDEQVSLLTLGMTGLEEQLANVTTEAEEDMARLSASLQDALDAGDMQLANQIREELTSVQFAYDKAVAEITGDMEELKAIGEATGIAISGLGEAGSIMVEMAQVAEMAEGTLTALAEGYLATTDGMNNTTAATREMLAGMEDLITKLGLGEEETGYLQDMLDKLGLEFMSGELSAGDLADTLANAMIPMLEGVAKEGEITTEAIKSIGAAIESLPSEYIISISTNYTEGDSADTAHIGGLMSHHYGGFVEAALAANLISASGGKMHTGGMGRSLAYDEVLRVLQLGEFVIQRDAVKYYGAEMFSALNQRLIPREGASYTAPSTPAYKVQDSGSSNEGGAGNNSGGTPSVTIENISVQVVASDSDDPQALGAAIVDQVFAQLKEKSANGEIVVYTRGVGDPDWNNARSSNA